MFFNTLQQLTTESMLYNKITIKPWQLIISCNSDSVNHQTHMQVIYNRGPFLIILQITNAIVGVFSAESLAVDSNINQNQDIDIPWSKDSFFFYYQQNEYIHIPLSKTQKNSVFGIYHQNPETRGLSFYYKNVKVLYISQTNNKQTTVNFDFSGMETLAPTQLHKSVDKYKLEKVEYWLASDLNKEIFNAPSIYFNEKIHQKLSSQWYVPFSPLNYYRPYSVYYVPSSLKIEQFSVLGFQQTSSEIEFQQTMTKEIVSGSHSFVRVHADSNQDIILDLYTDTNKLKQKPNIKLSTLPTLKVPIFQKFNEFNGFDQLMSICSDIMRQWQCVDAQMFWETWLKEIQFFSKIPKFLELLVGNKLCIDILIDVVSGIPDQQGYCSVIDIVTKKKFKPKIAEEKEQMAFDEIYNLLSQSVSTLNNEEFLELFKKGVIGVFLQRFNVLSQEVKRKYVYNNTQQKIEEDIPKLMNTTTSTTNIEQEEKIKKKKGVGYGSGVIPTTEWNVEEIYDRRNKNERDIIRILNLLTNLLKNKDVPFIVYDTICQSSLLPAMENCFSQGSLLEIQQNPKLVLSYLDLAKLFTRNQFLLLLLLPISKNYKPEQYKSVFQHLNNLKEKASMFLKCLPAEMMEVENQSKQLGEQIIQYYQEIEVTIENAKVEDEVAQKTLFDAIVDLPLVQAYRMLLKDQRFDYCKLVNEQGIYRHKYSGELQNEMIPSSKKLVRLAQELADLSNSLPYDHTNAIFIRVDTQRIDLMKAVIVGASGTPYAHGFFMHDVYFGNNYPETPPSVSLITTGGAQVRFNPNLYSDGKVCLSLLGTWRGQSSESWNPKISTFLQVLISIQGVVMSEDIYFNEPGYEKDAGTIQGNCKNEGYSNIVRYCNIKFAMIDVIRNPPQGFEIAVKRHFFIKKHEILKECYSWLERAQNVQALYDGLVNSHNHNWANLFRQEGKYYDMLKKIIQELEIELQNIQQPSIKDNQILQQQQQQPNQNQNKNEKIEVEYGQTDVEQQYYQEENKVEEEIESELNIADPGVMDRWSRYIGAMGVESIVKQAEASVYIVGVGPLGIEIAKNIVLSGVKKLTIHDTNICTYRDIGGGQFFLGENDIDKNRAVQSLQKLQQLNKYVRVDISILNGQDLSILTEEQLEQIVRLQEYNVIILTGTSYKVQQVISQFCRRHNIYVISCDIYGVFSRIYCDFGDNFIVIDKDGEHIQDLFIKHISNEVEGKVQLQDGNKHKLSEGDIVQINQVLGMYSLGEQQDIIQNKQNIYNNSINGTLHRVVRIINQSCFSIGDTTQYTQYQGNGVIKQQKIPISIKFEKLGDALNAKYPLFDQNMLDCDYTKMKNSKMSHIAFQTLDTFIQINNRYPETWSYIDNKQFMEMALDIIIVQEEDIDQNVFREFIIKFVNTCQYVFSPLAAFMGGYAAQECIKALTNKYMPTVGFMYIDNIELINNEIPLTLEELQNKQTKQNEIGITRDDSIKYILGYNLYSKLQNSRLLVVGAGAIGCELLKNMSILGIGSDTNGQITITDPDIIENSNLSRQFLFRERHIRQPKSLVAVAAAIQINPNLQGKLIPKMDRVQPSTEYIYSDEYLEQQIDIVVNALDNVQARKYIDTRCIQTKTPLLESGTLGPKGHLQVIIPYKTESYGSQQDPVEENDIPVCTLKMFPEDTVHCVEWARDKFGKIYTQKPQILLKLIEEFKKQDLFSLTQQFISNTEQQQLLRQAIKLLENKPISFQDCVIWARNKYQKYFVNDIRQLMYTYPLDTITKEGQPFWSLPKRPPNELNFNFSDELDSYFITSAACLRAKIFGINILQNVRIQQNRAQISKLAEDVLINDFKPSEQKAKQISQQVNKEQIRLSENSIQQQQQEQEQESTDYLINRFRNICSTYITNNNNKEQICHPEEFEKDNDDNLHIDYIYSMANLRAKTYQLEPMSWINVKLKAGRIIPALATTTACVAGLQTIELCKVLANLNVDQLRNGFLSLAVPLLRLSEPGSAPIYKLTNNISVSIWDRWDIYSSGDQHVSVKYVVQELQNKYGLQARDIFWRSTPVYLGTLTKLQNNQKDKEFILSQKLTDLLNIQDNLKYIDLTVLFEDPSNPEKLLEGSPPVRVYFK